jgi:DNA-binding PadR family transcriptional regulator
MTPQTFQILLALADGDRHGYAIMQEVEFRTCGQVKLGPGTLYGSVQRLLDEGLIKEVPGELDASERRRHYRLTREGRSELAAEAERMQNLVQMAHTKLAAGRKS